MSYENTRRKLAPINDELMELYESGTPLLVAVHKKPQFEIISFRPFVYNNYGLLHNRASIVSGELALRALLTMPHPDGGAVIYSGLQGENSAYGFRMDDPRQLNEITAELGRTEESFVFSQNN